MADLERTIQALEFLECNIKENISIAAMAEAACCSLFHFCRIFAATVQHTPYDFLMRRRLTEAALLLESTDRQIIDIALEYRFNAPETFTRAFKKMFRVTPSGWRSGKEKDDSLFIRALSPDYLQYINSDENRYIGMEKRIKRYLSGVSAEAPSPGRARAAAREEAARFLTDRFQEKDGLLVRYGDTRWLCTSGSSTADRFDPQLPISLMTLPEGRWHLFRIRQQAGEIRHLIEWINHTWSVQSGFRINRGIYLISGNRLAVPEFP